jgi:hypothetical protein
MPLKSTDRRRNRRVHRVEEPDSDDNNGAGQRAADLFNDRRKPNGRAKRAIK